MLFLENKVLPITLSARKTWCGVQGSNLRHPDWQPGALPAELTTHYNYLTLVDRGRIELPLHACKAHVLPLSLTARKLGIPYGF